MRTLQFVSYPFVNPMHGGQLRVSFMNKALQNAGIETFSISVFDKAHYQEYSELDFPIPSNLFTYYLADHPWDLMISNVVANNPELYPIFVERVRSVNADLYIFEQPWLWPLMRKVIQDYPELDRKIVFSTQNIEYELLRSILQSSTPILDKHDQWLVSYVYELEKELAERADLLIACTKTDAEMFSGNFAVKKVCVYANGISRPGLIPEEVRKKYVERYKNLHVASFVGSAHPPNADGWEKMMGKNMGFLPPDVKVIVVGGVADLLRNRSGDQRFSALNFSRIDMLGRLPAEDLNAILERSEVILLPITTGGGSNLKTAEALLTGKPIISTPLAFRGFSEFMDYPNVFITDDPVVFQKKLCEWMQNPPQYALSQEQNASLEKLLWENILKTYPKEIRKIVEP